MNRLRATQRSTIPLVYFDQWAYMWLVKDGRDFERFAKALLHSGGTLAFSVFNFFELSQITDFGQLQKIEELIRKVWPHLAFIQPDPTIVVSSEDDILRGVAKSAPHLDDWMLNKYIELYRPGVNPLDPQGFLLQLRNPGVAQGLKVAWQLLAEKIGSAIESARSSYLTDRDAKKEVDSCLKGIPIPHPTRYVFEQTIYKVTKDNLNTDNLNNVTDFFHMIVPLSYCDIVLLDKEWAQRARQVQKSVRDAGLLTHESAVYSIKNLDQFWTKLDSFSRRGALACS